MKKLIIHIWQKTIMLVKVTSNEARQNGTLKLESVPDEPLPLPLDLDPEPEPRLPELLTLVEDAFEPEADEEDD